MASELSRLIDDELEKFERRPSAEAQTGHKAAFRVKAASSRDSAKPSVSWRTREWWTWKRLAYACLAGAAFFAIVYAVTRGSSSIGSTAVAGTNAVLQQSDATLTTGINDSEAQVHEETSKEATPSLPQHSRDTFPDSQGSAGAATVAEAPAWIGTQGPSAVGAVAPMNAVSEAPVEAAQHAPAPSAFVVAMPPGNDQNAGQAPSPEAFGDGRAAEQGPASSPEAFAAQIPVSTVKFPDFGRRLLRQH